MTSCLGTETFGAPRLQIAGFVPPVRVFEVNAEDLFEGCVIGVHGTAGDGGALFVLQLVPVDVIPMYRSPFLKAAYYLWMTDGI